VALVDRRRIPRPTLAHRDGQVAPPGRPEPGSARDRAGLGNLYLQDGVWEGKRLLPEGYAAFVSTLAPAWEADGRPVYGGFFWLNGDGEFPVPHEAYYMAGAGGQYTFVIPSHDLVVVRLGHYKGADPGERGL